jgi:hypothetical protein
MSELIKNKEIHLIISHLSNNFTRIISRDELRNTILDWGDNGIGDRFANKQYNYGCIYSNKKVKIYSENDDKISETILNEFYNIKNIKGNQIIGIYIFSKKINLINRNINNNIKKIIHNMSCVVCGSNSDIICDHKNDLYNDERIINTKTQVYDDFQPLCNHCNLQKRQILKIETSTQKIYSAKNIPTFKVYPFEFPWEKKIFDKNDINCKKDTYWYDPIEFNIKILWYIPFTFVLKELKKSIIKNMNLNNLMNKIIIID